MKRLILTLLIALAPGSGMFAQGNLKLAGHNVDTLFSNTCLILLNRAIRISITIYDFFTMSGIF